MDPLIEQTSKSPLASESKREPGCMNQAPRSTATRESKMVDGPSTASMPDEEIVAQQVETLKNSIESIEGLLDVMIGANVYDKLSVEDKVKYDLFLSYSLTSLYWMYLRTSGENPLNHPVKGEIDRIQDYVKKYQRVKDRKKRPQLQKDAAKRFVKSGLWDPAEAPKASNKRKKFEENEEAD